MRQNPDFVVRKVAGEMVLVPIARDAADLESVFTLNEVGARIWELIETCADERAIAKALTEEYEVTEDRAFADVAELLRNLRDINAVIDD